MGERKEGKWNTIRGKVKVVRVKKWTDTKPVGWSDRRAKPLLFLQLNRSLTNELDTLRLVKIDFDGRINIDSLVRVKKIVQI